MTIRREIIIDILYHLSDLEWTVLDDKEENYSVLVL